MISVKAVTSISIIVIGLNIQDIVRNILMMTLAAMKQINNINIRHIISDEHMNVNYVII